MRHFLLLALAVLCGFLGYQVYRDREQIQVLEQRCAQLQQALSAAQAGRAPGLAHCTCPLCRGEGKLVVHRADGRNLPYVCPLCQGKGYRDLQVPPGYKLCPDCSGMGVVQAPVRRLVSPRAEATEDARLTSAPCVRCHGTGLVKSP